MLCFDHTETHRSNHSTKLLFCFDHTETHRSNHSTKLLFCFDHTETHRSNHSTKLMFCFDHTETHRSNHSTKLLFTPTIFDHTVIWDYSTSHFLILLRFSILFLFMLVLRWNHSHFRRHFHHYLILQCQNRRGTLDSRIEQFPGHDHLLRQQRHTRLVFLVEVY